LHLEQITADQGFVRHLNKSVLLNLLRLRSPLSRADLAKLSGLTRATVSTLVQQLVEDHLVEETGFGKSRPGRPSRLLDLNASGGYAIGADLGVDYLLVVVLDLKGRPIWRKRDIKSERSDAREHVASLAQLIEEGIDAIPPTPLGPLGIGVGVHGLVEYPRGHLVFAPNLAWRDVPVADMLAKRFSIPVFVDNEANAGALAETWVGAAREVQNLVYLSIGIGLGTGIVIDGELYRGATGTAGEFGHTTVDAFGPLCGCGNRGCLEVFASERALISDLQPLRFDSATVAADQVFRAADDGEPVAIAALRRVGEYLGIGVANVVNTFNPQLVVIGGPMARGGAYLLDPVQHVVEQRALAHPRLSTRVAISQLGESACAIGSGVMVLKELFRAPRGEGRTPSRPAGRPAGSVEVPGSGGTPTHRG
jgi:glucokinase-like ROK family protein